MPEYICTAEDVEFAKEIAAMLAEDDLNPRRERAAFVGRLRDKHKLKYRQIGKHLNVSTQRAHQLYALNRAFRECVDDSVL